MTCWSGGQRCFLIPVSDHVLFRLPTWPSWVSKQGPSNMRHLPCAKNREIRDPVMNTDEGAFLLGQVGVAYFMDKSVLPWERQREDERIRKGLEAATNWWQPEGESYSLSQIREAGKSCVKLEICSETVMRPTLFDCLRLAVQKWMAPETFAAGERIYFKFNEDNSRSPADSWLISTEAPHLTCRPSCLHWASVGSGQQQLGPQENRLCLFACSWFPFLDG